MEVCDTLGFLLGAWALARAIDDHRWHRHGRVEGRATLLAPGAADVGGAVARARYEEAGVLRVGTYTGPVSRRLDYVREAGGGATVYFCDGSPFLEVDLRGGRWQGVHRCGGDLYEISMLVRTSRVVEERWRVRGPAKSYDAVTTLTRLDR